MPVPVGLIGAGKHGARYLRHLVEDVPELRIALLSRRDRDGGERQAGEVGARFVGDFRDLVVSPEIDAVIAVAPPHLHEEIATLAAGSGKGLLIEKPLSVDGASGRRIVAALDGAGVPAMVAHTLRFNQVVRAIRREMETLGSLRQLWLSQRFEPSTLDWLDDPARSGGGMLLHTGVHSFDLVRHLSGREPVTAFCRTLSVVTHRTEDNFAAILGFDGEPLLAGVSGSRATAGRNGTIEVAGEGGQLLGDHHHGTLVRVEGGQTRRIDPGPPTPTVREVLRAFADLLTRGGPSPIPPGEGLRAVAIAEACHLSAASGTSVPLPGRGLSLHPPNPEC